MRPKRSTLSRIAVETSSSWQTRYGGYVLNAYVEAQLPMHQIPCAIVSRNHPLSIASFEALRLVVVA